MEGENIGMIDVILNALAQCQIREYFVTETKTSSTQLYFVKKNLDQIRSVQMTDYSVSVFRDIQKEGNTLTGSATCNIEEGMREQEIVEKLSKAYAACEYSANPEFHFLPGVKETRSAVENRLTVLPLEEAAWKFAEALFKNDIQNDPLVNSAEIFANRKECRIIGGNGCDVSYVTYSVDGEFVVQCKKKNDVEMYHMFSYDDLDLEDLSDKVKEALEMVVSRSLSEKITPRGNCAVIFSDKSVQTILKYYEDRANAAYIYPGYSDFKKDMDVMGETTGDRVTMELIAKEPFSSEGVPMKNRMLLEDGVLKTIQGHTRLCSYLGEKPVGVYQAAKVTCGNLTFQEMTQRRVLHLVSFSDFQMDIFSGYFGGEIRLGYLYEDGKVVPVTGGSVSGSFIELQKNIRFSKEQQKSSTFVGPKHILFDAVPINGEE